MKKYLLLAACFIFAGCSASTDKESLIIMSTADLHGHVFPWDYYADQPDEQHSLLKAASLVDSIRARHPKTLLLDGGDWLQGNPFAEFYAKVDTVSPYPLLTAAEAMQFDAIVLGNHEFNFGIPLLNHRISQTDVTFLGANIRDFETGEAAYQPYILNEFDGFSVGVVGLTTPGSAVWDRQHVEGILEFGDGPKFAAKYVQELRDAGADAVVILMHSGFETGSSYTRDDVPVENFGRLILDTVPGIDAMVIAHSHRVTEMLYEGSEVNPPVPVIQAGRWGSHLGFTELFIHREVDGSVRFTPGRNMAIPVEDQAPHAELSSLLEDEHQRVRDYISEAIATTSAAWNSDYARVEDTPIIDLIQHIQKKHTGADLSTSAAFNLSAGFGAGSISRGELARLYPYENTLFKLEINGEILRKYLEHSALYFATSDETGRPQPSGNTPGFNFDMISGVDYTMDIRREPGDRITSLQYNGQPVQPDQKFTIAINSYRAAGGGDYDMLRDAKVLYESAESVRAIMEAYLTERGNIEPEDVFKQNWALIY